MPKSKEAVIVSKTARYRIIKDSGGNRYRFFCELSGMAVHTTEPYHGDTPEKELDAAWQEEGRLYFDRWRKCGKWVCGAMYNADELECVECTPWENRPRYCPSCGKAVAVSDIYCGKCGLKLQYRKVEKDDGGTN